MDLDFDNLAAASANIQAGKLKSLAVTTARRTGLMPDVPTVAESSPALAGFDIDTWFGIFGPARLPADVTQRLNKAFLRRRLELAGAESAAGHADGRGHADHAGPVWRLRQARAVQVREGRQGQRRHGRLTDAVQRSLRRMKPAFLASSG